MTRQKFVLSRIIKPFGTKKMPKTKPRHATQLDSQQARLHAASKFVSGDRVTHRLTGKVGKFVSINRGFALLEVWVEFETDSERSIPISCNPLDLELIQRCQEDTQCLAASAGSQDCATEESQKLDSNTNSESPNSSKQIPTAELSLPSISLPSPATTTSEHIALRSDNSISSLEEVPVKEIASPTRMEKGLTTTAQDYGGKCGELSPSSDPSLSCGKTLLPPDIPSQDSQTVLSPELLGVLPASGMYASGKLSVPSPRAHPTDEIASSSSHSKKLLPTPMAHSRAKTTYSRPGQDKLEQKLRELGVIPPGHVSHPAVREFMMGFPDGWTDITRADGGQVPNPVGLAPQSVVFPIELQELPPLETLAHPPKQRLPKGHCQRQSRLINRVNEVTADSGLESDLAGSKNVDMEQLSLDIEFNANQIIPDDKLEDINQTETAFIHPDVQKDSEFLSLSLIATDGGTQSRAKLNDETINEYAEAMDLGATFPPVLVFYDGESYWLADGFHRVAAAQKLGWTDIKTVIRSGTHRDAVLHSVGANACHGLRRTNADKRRAVEILLRDEEWGQWSNRVIALQCGVSSTFVDRLRNVSANRLQIESEKLRNVSANRLQIESEISSIGSELPEADDCGRASDRYFIRNGKTHSQDTRNIGKKSKKRTDGIVERLKQKDTAPKPILYAKGDVFQIQSKSGELKKYDGCWAIATQVNEYTICVNVHDGELTVQPDNLKPIDSSSEGRNIQSIHQRLKRLHACGLLDRGAYYILEGLGRQTYLTELEAMLLTCLENHYGVVEDD